MQLRLWFWSLFSCRIRQRRQSEWIHYKAIFLHPALGKQHRDGDERSPMATPGPEGESDGGSEVVMPALGPQGSRSF